MSSIVDELRAVLGGDAVLVGEAVGARATNYWDAAPLQCKALIRPRTTDDVSRALRICHAAGQPVVTHGGLTGACGGDRCTASDIVLSLERMDRIEEIDAVGATATVQAGCRLQTLQEAAAGHDLYFPLDLGARGSCTVGGNAATNAGGINVIRYGMMREQILGMEAVLADGTIVSSMNRMLKNNAGYDLKQLFIGSEGTLGVIARIVLRLRERPLGANTALIALSDFEQVIGLLRHLQARLGGGLSSFEAMWGEYFRAVTAPGFHRAPLGREHAFYVVMETQGADEGSDSDRIERALGSALAAGSIADCVIAKSRQERDRLWAIRENFEAILQHRPQFLYDVSLPVEHMASYVEQLAQRVEQQWPESRFNAMGHVGDGNLHFFICPGTQGDDLHARADEFVYAPLREIGGSISAEHGIGLEKRAYLTLSRSAEEIQLMRVVKQALDPKGILNPGKVVAVR